jgi:hypothetical protein
MTEGQLRSTQDTSVKSYASDDVVLFKTRSFSRQKSYQNVFIFIGRDSCSITSFTLLPSLVKPAGWGGSIHAPSNGILGMSMPKCSFH